MVFGVAYRTLDKRSIAIKTVKWLISCIQRRGKSQYSFLYFFASKEIDFLFFFLLFLKDSWATVLQAVHWDTGSLWARSFYLIIFRGFFLSYLWIFKHQKKVTNSRHESVLCLHITDNLYCCKSTSFVLLDQKTGLSCYGVLFKLLNWEVEKSGEQNKKW